MTLQITIPITLQTNVESSVQNLRLNRCANQHRNHRMQTAQNIPPPLGISVVQGIPGRLITPQVPEGGRHSAHIRR